MLIFKREVSQPLSAKAQQARKYDVGSTLSLLYSFYLGSTIAYGLSNTRPAIARRSFKSSISASASVTVKVTCLL